jgi:hypothetical protein
LNALALRSCDQKENDVLISRYQRTTRTEGGLSIGTDSFGQGDAVRNGWPKSARRPGTCPRSWAAAPPQWGALIREYLFILLLRACAESLASENASHVAAMERADRNINDLLEQLHGTFHQLRHSGIDEELFDMISGSGAGRLADHASNDVERMEMRISSRSFACRKDTRSTIDRWSAIVKPVYRSKKEYEYLISSERTRRAIKFATVAFFTYPIATRCLSLQAMDCSMERRRHRPHDVWSQPRSASGPRRGPPIEISRARPALLADRHSARRTAAFQSHQVVEAAGVGSTCL